MNTRRHMTVRDFPALRDEAGRRLCRWCRKPVAPPRRTMCSAECVHEMELRTNKNYLRSHILNRDAGVCALCGADTLKIRRVLNILRRGHGRYDDCRGVDHEAWRWYVLHLRLGAHRAFSGDLWDADHIVPVSQGGGGCGLDNLRTLCISCHKDVTREMHRRRKANAL